jgi:hypothetical protein
VYDPAVSWLLPTPMLLFAGVVALIFVPVLSRRPVSQARLAVEAFACAHLSVAVVWAAWIILWLIEQRW